MNDKPEGAKCYIPRLEMTMRDIPDKYHEFLWEYTGEGKAPHSVEAAVKYVETTLSQDEVAEEYGLNPVSISKTTKEMVNRGVVDESEITTVNVEHENVPQFGQERAIKGGHEGAKAINNK